VGEEKLRIDYQRLASATGGGRLKVSGNERRNTRRRKTQRRAIENPGEKGRKWVEGERRRKRPLHSAPAILYFLRLPKKSDKDA